MFKQKTSYTQTFASFILFYFIFLNIDGIKSQLTGIPILAGLFPSTTLKMTPFDKSVDEIDPLICK